MSVKRFFLIEFCPQDKEWLLWDREEINDKDRAIKEVNECRSTYRSLNYLFRVIEVESEEKLIGIVKE